MLNNQSIFSSYNFIYRVKQHIISCIGSKWLYCWISAIHIHPYALQLCGWQIPNCKSALSVMLQTTQYTVANDTKTAKLYVQRWSASNLIFEHHYNRSGILQILFLNRYNIKPFMIHKTLFAGTMNTRIVMTIRLDVPLESQTSAYTHLRSESCSV